MAFMAWTDELATGISQVDEQHKWLVDATNRLHDALNQPTPDAAAVSDVLFGLVDYTYNHFIMEEELFQRLGYPETEAHKAQHNAFTGKVTALLQRHEHGEPVTNETLVFLKDWLIQHIMKTDKAYVPFLKEKGVR
jgi:hemerythrin